MIAQWIRYMVSTAFAGLCVYDGYTLINKSTIHGWVLLFVFFTFTAYGLFVTEQIRQSTSEAE